MKKAHDEIATVIQKIWDEEKVKITSVGIVWHDLTTGSGYKYSVRVIRTDSETHHQIGGHNV